MSRIRALSILMLVISLFCEMAAAKAEEPDEQEFWVWCFGHYEQDNDPTDGEEPIEWIVLECVDDKALLTTVYALDCQPYNEGKAEVTWETSTLRKWLNEVFYDAAFTEEEKELILLSTVSNQEQEGNAEWDSVGGGDTEDKVFLLSVGEVQRYFDDFTCSGTEYAKDKGANIPFLNKTSWWLRSPGKKQSETATAGLGKIDSTPVSKNGIGVCPAIWVDIAADWEHLPFERFCAADELAESGKYMEAALKFDELGTYFDCVGRAGACRFLYAWTAMDEQDYETALERWDAYKEFSLNNLGYLDPDSIELEAESNYRVAFQRQSEGKYNEAIERYSQINQYRDAMKQIVSCFDKAGINYYWLTRDTGSVFNTGKDNGYKERNQIEPDDPHFGWNLGRFMLSGFTEMSDDGEIPVFIKTPGKNHQLVLWFDLDQDIDCLNGNDKLLIADDINGKDIDLSIGESDFGRGALFIRHIDFRNSGSVQPYYNYLAASETSTADTRVEIHEEGTYQVVLDYEIQDKDIKHLYNRINNYRIGFEFEVRNGSGMFYLFDLGTKSELEDYSIAPDGFRVDLAQSHSLSVDYVRKNINQSGSALDVRKSAKAADGEAFDDGGYYEIKVTNRETGEVLIKHVFVGTSAELEAFKRIAPEMENFGNGHTIM